MSNPEHSNVPSIPDQPVPSTVTRTRESLLADDIVVLSSAGLGVTVGSHHLSPPAIHELSPPGCRGRVTRFKLLWSASAVQLSSPV